MYYLWCKDIFLIHLRTFHLNATAREKNGNMDPNLANKTEQF